MRNPYEDDFAFEFPDGHPGDDEGNGEWDCPCGADHCRGYDDDPNLIRLFGKFYASDCAMANGNPEVMRDREQASRADVMRDDQRRSS